MESDESVGEEDDGTPVAKGEPEVEEKLTDCRKPLQGKRTREKRLERSAAEAKDLSMSTVRVREWSNLSFN